MHTSLLGPGTALVLQLAGSFQSPLRPTHKARPGFVESQVPLPVPPGGGVLVGVAVGVGVLVAVAVGVAVGVGVLVAVAVGLLASVLVGLGVGVSVLVAVGLLASVLVGLGVGVGVALASWLGLLARCGVGVCVGTGRSSVTSGAEPPPPPINRGAGWFAATIWEPPLSVGGVGVVPAAPDWTGGCGSAATPATSGPAGNRLTLSSSAL